MDDIDSLASLIAQYPALQPWTTNKGERVEFIPFQESINHQITTHAYAIPFVDSDTCVIPKRGNGKWWLAGGTAEQDETWQETLSRELREELGAEIKKFQPIGAYRTTGEKTTYRVVSWADVELSTTPNDPDGELGIVEFKLICPHEAPNYYEADLAHFGVLYLLAAKLRRGIWL